MSASAPPLHGPSVALAAAGTGRVAGRRAARARRLGLRSVALGYLAVLLLGPVAMIFYRTFEHGMGAVWSALTASNAQHAFWLSLEIAAIAVPLNTVFGIGAALLLERGRFRGRAVLGLLIDLPFALPTIVAGLVLLSLYGPKSPVGVNVAFTRASVALALLFVTLPFVVRSVQPVLHELDVSMEEAAASLGAGPFTTVRRIVLPNLTPAIVSGVALSFARAVGEFGSLVLLTGNIPFKTQAASVFIFSQVESDNVAGAAAVSVVLLGLSLAVLLAMGYVSRRVVRNGG